MQYAIYDENVSTQIENEELYTKGIMLFFFKKKKSIHEVLITVPSLVLWSKLPLDQTHNLSESGDG